MPLLRGQQRKGIYLFYACGYLPFNFFNRTKTMRLMLSNEQISDFLTHFRIDGLGFFYGKLMFQTFNAAFTFALFFAFLCKLLNVKQVRFFCILFFS